MIKTDYINKSFSQLKPFVQEGFCACSCNRTKLAINCLVIISINIKKKKNDYTFY